MCSTIDPVLEAVGVSAEAKDVVADDAEALQGAREDDDDLSFFEV